MLDGTLWAEWRLLVGRGHAEVTEQGAVAPARIAGLLKQRTMEVRTRVADAGLGVRDGIRSSWRSTSPVPLRWREAAVARITVACLPGMRGLRVAYGDAGIIAAP